MSTESNAIKLNQSCSPIPNNHCVDFHFNTTELFRKFSQQYASLINQLFAREDRQYALQTNSLHFHIEYDTHDSFTFNTFRIFDQIENRQYHSISFELKNRQNQLILPLNDDIKNMTLQNLQINIHCSARGLYQYNYIVNHRQSLLKSLICELPTTTTTMTTIITTSKEQQNTSTILAPSSSTTNTRKNLNQSILFYSLIGGGSLIPCLILAYCLYMILYEQINVNEPINILQRDSLTSSISASVFSDERHILFE